MSIFDSITEQMKAAMLAKDAPRLSALRNIRAAFLTEMKKSNAKGLPDEICVDLLRRLEKQRKESIEAFEKGGRAEQAAAETAELKVIAEFLPKLADEATTKGWVEEAIQATNASQPNDVGKVMGALMKAHKGEVDGTLARNLAAKILAG
ncbi:MAG TPA: GatB/YqeY domain-containing protein [bacterium]|nr:GatB/YqeY domain-containing protein [bacterium]